MKTSTVRWTIKSMVFDTRNQIAMHLRGVGLFEIRAALSPGERLMSNAVSQVQDEFILQWKKP